MYHLILQVRGGGVFVKTDKLGFCCLELSRFSDGSPGLELINNSSIDGMLSHLLGELAPIYTPEKSSVLGRSRLFRDPMCESLASRAKTRITRGPFVDVFLERKDAFRKQGTLNPSINLRNISWEQADPTVQLLKDELIKATGKDSVWGCNTVLQEAQKAYRENVKKSEDYASSLASKLPSFERFPQAGLIERIAAFVEKITNSAEAIPPVNSEVLVRLIAVVHERLSQDEAYVQRLATSKYKKWSCFDAPAQTRQWASTSAAEYVRGGPAQVIQIDFDILIERLSEEELRRLEAGPLIGRWGEGGVVFANIMSTIPAHFMIPPLGSSCFSLEELRRLGLKFRKIDTGD